MVKMSSKMSATFHSSRMQTLQGELHIATRNRESTSNQLEKIKWIKEEQT